MAWSRRTCLVRTGNNKINTYKTDQDSLYIYTYIYIHTVYTVLYIHIYIYTLYKYLYIEDIGYTITSEKSPVIR